MEARWGERPREPFRDYSGAAGGIWVRSAGSSEPRPTVLSLCLRWGERPREPFREYAHAGKPICGRTDGLGRRSLGEGGSSGASPHLLDGLTIGTGISSWTAVLTLLAALTVVEPALHGADQPVPPATAVFKKHFDAVRGRAALEAIKTMKVKGVGQEGEGTLQSPARPQGKTTMPAGLDRAPSLVLINSLSAPGKLEIVRRPAAGNFGRGERLTLPAWNAGSGRHAQVDLLGPRNRRVMRRSWLR